MNNLNEPAARKRAVSLKTIIFIVTFGIAISFVPFNCKCVLLVCDCTSRIWHGNTRRIYICISLRRAVFGSDSLGHSTVIGIRRYHARSYCRDGLSCPECPIWERKININLKSTSYWFGGKPTHRFVHSNRVSLPSTLNRIWSIFSIRDLGAAISMVVHRVQWAAK